MMDTIKSPVTVRIILHAFSLAIIPSYALNNIYNCASQITCASPLLKYQAYLLDLLTIPTSIIAIIMISTSLIIVAYLKYIYTQLTIFCLVICKAQTHMIDGVQEVIDGLSLGEKYLCRLTDNKIVICTYIIIDWIVILCDIFPLRIYYKTEHYITLPYEIGLIIFTIVWCIIIVASMQCMTYFINYKRRKPYRDIMTIKKTLQKCSRSRESVMYGIDEYIIHDIIGLIANDKTNRNHNYDYPDDVELLLF